MFCCCLIAISILAIYFSLFKIKNPLQRLMKLQPKNYRFKHDVIKGYENFIFDGFLAHEVEDIIPMAVSGVKDDENIMQQLDYSKFTPLCVGAIQELNNKIDKMQEQINNQNKLIQLLMQHTNLENN